MCKVGVAPFSSIYLFFGYFTFPELLFTLKIKHVGKKKYGSTNITKVGIKKRIALTDEERSSFLVDYRHL